MSYVEKKCYIIFCPRKQTVYAVYTDKEWAERVVRSRNKTHGTILTKYILIESLLKEMSKLKEIE